MRFRIAHNSINVLNLEKQVEFYEKALGLTVSKRIDREGGDRICVFLSDGDNPNTLELTYMKGREKPYDLGDTKSHTAFHVDDYEAAHKIHQSMGCIIEHMIGRHIYFIKDTEGYISEIIEKVL